MNLSVSDLLRFAAPTDWSDLSALVDAIEGAPHAVATYPPSLHHDLVHHRFVALRSLSRFWTEQSPRELAIRWEEAVAALHALGSTATFMVANQLGRDLKYSVAFETPGVAQAAAGVLRSSLPGSEFCVVEDARERAAALNLLEDLDPTCAIIGVPGLRTSGGRVDLGLISRIAGALPSVRWALVLQATPLPRDGHDLTLAELATRVALGSRWATRQIPDLANTQVSEADILAERYVELHRAEFERVSSGRRIGSWATQTYFLSESEDAALTFKAVVAGAVATKSAVQPMQVLECRAGDGDGGLVTTLTSQEIAVFTRPPSDELPGIRIKDYARFDVHPELPVSHRPLELGTVMGTSAPVRISMDDLSRHALVVGITGSGKTTTIWSLLAGLDEAEEPMPFLVIEPVKHEYRDMPLAVPPRVFTVGDERVSPLRLNPFEVPDGILVQSHIDFLNALFRASFALYPPMPYVLERCIYEVYTDIGWDLARNAFYGADTGARFPTLASLAHKVEEVTERLGYANEVTLNVRAALLTRINTLRIGAKGAMLDTGLPFDVEALLSCPTVIELERVGNDEEKAFLMGLLFTRVFEHRQAQGAVPGGVARHALVIEEAHRLLRQRVTSADPETADPAAHAVEQFSNMLAEIRSLGEGVVVVDQIPAKLTSDVVKNTSLKIAFRLAAQDDKASIGSTINLTDDQSRVLTAMPRGEAVVFQEGMDSPLHVRMSGLALRQRAEKAQRDDAKIREDMRAVGALVNPDYDDAHLDAYTAANAARIASDNEVVSLWMHALLLAAWNASAEGPDRLGGLLDGRIQAARPVGVKTDRWVSSVVRALGDAGFGRMGASAASLVQDREGASAADASAELRSQGAEYRRRMLVGMHPYGGCASVCPGGGCLFRTLASRPALDPAFVGGIRTALFDSPVPVGVQSVLLSARKVGRSSLTAIEESVPLRLGLCAVVQTAARLVSEDVAADFVGECVDLATGRGELDSEN